MSQEKQYQSLYENKIFMGGAADVEAMVKNEELDLIVDLRAEATGCAYPEAKTDWVQIPLGDKSQESQEALIQQAVDTVVSAYKSGKKVGFHCAGGGGRTGAVAVGVLIALGQSSTVDEAEQKAKSIRSAINIKPAQKAAILNIYPNE